MDYANCLRSSRFNRAPANGILEFRARARLNVRNWYQSRMVTWKSTAVCAVFAVSRESSAAFPTFRLAETRDRTRRNPTDWISPCTLTLNSLADPLTLIHRRGTRAKNLIKAHHRRLFLRLGARSPSYFSDFRIFRGLHHFFSEICSQNSKIHFSPWYDYILN